jgi:hypothetical protein
MNELVSVVFPIPLPFLHWDLEMRGDLMFTQDVEVGHELF